MHLYGELPMELEKILSPSRGAIFKGALNNSSEFCMKMPASITSTSWELEYIVRGYHISILVRLWIAPRRLLIRIISLSFFYGSFSLRAQNCWSPTKTISWVSSLFIDKGGTIHVSIIARQKRSEPPQCGLDVPCKITFTGSKNIVKKCKKVILRIMNGCAKYILRLGAFT